MPFGKHATTALLPAGNGGHLGPERHFVLAQYHQGKSRQRGCWPCCGQWRHRSDTGRGCRDTFLGPTKTCAKLKIAF